MHNSPHVCLHIKYMGLEILIKKLNTIPNKINMASNNWKQSIEFNNEQRTLFICKS